MLVRNRTTSTDSDVTNKERVTSFHVVTIAGLALFHDCHPTYVQQLLLFCAPTAFWVYTTTAAIAGESDGRGGDDVNMEQNDGRCGDDTSTEQNDREWQ